MLRPGREGSQLTHTQLHAPHETTPILILSGYVQKHLLRGFAMSFK